MCLKKHLARCPAITEMKFRLRLFCCQFDHIHLIQLLLSGHRHISCRNSGLVSGNEILKFTDLLLLTAICCLELRFLHCINFLEMLIITYVTVQFLIFHMINDIYHFVKEWNIMRNQDEGIFVIQQITFQPCDMFFIEVVCRLVQKKDIRLFQKQFAQKYFCSLATAQIRHITVKTQIQKPQCSGNLFYLCIDHIKIMKGKLILNCAEFFHQHVHFFLICTSEKITDFVHTLFFLKQRIKCRFQDFLDRHPFLQDGMLIQIAGMNIFCPFYLTFIRHQPTSNNTHKCGLSFTVCADKSYMFPF